MNIKPVALLALLVFSPLSNAELLDYTFTATVTGIVIQSDREFDGALEMDTLSGTLTVDTSVAPIVADGTLTAWIGAAVALNISIGDYSVLLPPETGTVNLVQVNQSTPALGNTVNAGFTTVSNTVDDWMASSFTLFANDFDGVAFNQPALPLSFDGADVVEGLLVFSSTLNDGVSFHGVQFDITSMEVTTVPLPAAFWLFASSVLMLWSRTHRAI